MWSGVRYCNFCVSRSLDFFLYAHIPLLVLMCCAGRITLHSSAVQLGLPGGLHFLGFPHHSLQPRQQINLSGHILWRAHGICGGAGIAISALWNPDCSTCPSTVQFCARPSLTCLTSQNFSLGILQCSRGEMRCS